MIEILYNILIFLYDGILTLIDIILSIPSFIAKLPTYYRLINVVNAAQIAILITTIVAVHVAIKIKRLIV